MKNTSLSLIFFFLSAMNIALGQSSPQQTDFQDFTKRVNIVPPSPVAATLGVYGNASPDLVSGAVRVAVPLYNFNMGSKSIPIGLNYSSNGFKVDDLQSFVGLGWTLQAGGMISRTILGAPDETTTRFVPPQNISTNVREYKDFLQQASVDPSTASMDAQPDPFSFNFAEGNGSFVLDRNLTPTLLAYSNLRIEKNFDVTAEWNFRITTIDGTQYFFGGPSATEYTKSGTAGCGWSHPDYQPTGWFLNKILCRNGDIIQFQYNNVFLSSFYGASETLYKWLKSSEPCIDAGNYGDLHTTITCPTYTDVLCKNIFVNSTKLLTKIQSTRYGSVEFEYQERVDINTNQPLADKLLTKVKIVSASGNALLLLGLIIKISIQQHAQIVESFPRIKTGLFYHQLMRSDLIMWLSRHIHLNIMTSIIYLPELLLHRTIGVFTMDKITRD